MSGDNKIQVYYNSACPVCKAGIENQRMKMQECDVAWKDVHTVPEWTRETGSELEFVRERLHVIDENGDVQVGFDALIAIWRNSPKEQWKSNVFGKPVIKNLGRAGYNTFAALLYQWNRSKKHW